MKSDTKKLAVSALLVALDVVLTRLLALNTPVMKIGLGFAAVALSAMLYGPCWAMLTSALGDLLGALLFPTGAYFPGFTLTAACTGLLFGLCLYRRPPRLVYAALAAGLNTLLVMFPAQLLILAWLKRSKLVAKLLEKAGT